MKRLFTFVTLVLLISSVALAGPISITIRPAVAPNFFGSPSYGAWQTNAINALIAGTNNIGVGAANFTSKGSFQAEDLVVSDFQSWQAKTPGAFAGEFGNRITFATLIRDTSGAKIDVASGITVLVPPFGTNLGFPSIVGTSYTSSGPLFRTVGFNIVGGVVDTTSILTSGTGARDAIALFPGLGYQALASDVDDMGNPFPSLQANLNDLVAGIKADPTNGQITDCTTFLGTTNCATVGVTNVVPEPGTISLLGLGLLALGRWARRQKG